MNHRDRIYDQLLVLRCQEGAADALDELLARWQERLWRHARRLTDDSEAAWDILQETMMVISRRIGDLSDPAAFSAWAYRIATNECRDFFRREQRHHRLAEAFSEEPPPVVRGPDHTTVLDVQAALAQLPGPQQTLLILRYEEGFSTDEMAHILGIPAGTVKSRLHAARQNLRLLLEELEP